MQIRLPASAMPQRKGMHPPNRHYPSLRGSAAQTSTISKSALATPQSGHSQFAGMSSHLVPGAMPSSGSPAASTKKKPHTKQRKENNKNQNQKKERKTGNSILDAGSRIGRSLT